MSAECRRVKRQPVSRADLLHYLESALPWAVVATVFWLPVSEALKNIAFVLSLALYIGLLFAGRERILVPPAGWVFLSLLGVTILSAAVSQYPGKAIRGVWEVFRYASFFFIVGRGVREEKQLRLVLWAAVTGLGITGLVTLFRHLVLGRLLFPALSLGLHSNVAEYVVMALALMYGLYLHADVVGGRRVWLIMVAGVSITLLGFSHARMSWAAFLVVGLVLGWLRSARVAGAALAVSLLLMLGVALLEPGVKGQIASLTEIESYRNMGDRVPIWKKAFAMWRDAPWLGVGPRAFVLHKDPAHDPQRRKYAFVVDHVHSLWLQTAVEMGLLGVLVLAGSFGYLGLWLIRSRQRFLVSWPAAVWDGAFGSWLAILITSVTDTSFSSKHAMFFSMLLALHRTGAVAGEQWPGSRTA